MTTLDREQPRATDGARGDGGARPLPLTLAVPAAVLAGVALLLAFPPYGMWPLAPVGVALLAAAAHRRRLRAGAGLGFLTGVALFAPLLEWTNLHTGYLPWALLSLLQAAYLALLGAATAWVSPLADRHRAAWPLLTGVLWVGAGGAARPDPVRRVPVGAAGVQPGHVAAAAAGRARRRAAGHVRGRGRRWVLVAVAWRDWRRAPGQWRPVAGLTAALVALLAAGPAVPAEVRGADGTVTVAIVQGNVPRLGLDFNAQRQAVLNNHVDATLELAERVTEGGQPRPDLVVWPENSSDIDPLRNPDAGAADRPGRRRDRRADPGRRGARRPGAGAGAQRGAAVAARHAASTWTRRTSSGIRCRSPSTCRCVPSPAWSARRSTGSAPTSSPVTGPAWWTPARRSSAT